MRTFARFALIAATLTVLAGCAHRSLDRSWVSDRRFHSVWVQHENLGSIEATRALLEAQPWPRSEINECVYRIQALENARALYPDLRFPPRGEPRPLLGATLQVN